MCCVCTSSQASGWELSREIARGLWLPCLKLTTQLTGHRRSHFIFQPQMDPYVVQVHQRVSLKFKNAINQVVGNFFSPAKILIRESGRKGNDPGDYKMYKYSCPFVLLLSHEEKGGRMANGCGSAVTPLKSPHLCNPPHTNE